MQSKYSQSEAHLSKTMPAVICLRWKKVRPAFNILVGLWLHILFQFPKSYVLIKMSPYNNSLMYWLLPLLAVELKLVMEKQITLNLQ